jgi:hypothetical protein
MIRVSKLTWSRAERKRAKLPGKIRSPPEGETGCDDDHCQHRHRCVGYAPCSSPVRNCARPWPNDQSSSSFSVIDTIKSAGSNHQGPLSTQFGSKRVGQAHCADLNAQ